MNRIGSWRWNGAIDMAREALPQKAWAMVKHIHWFVDCDPIWAGLHRYKATPDGRSYRDLSHFVPVNCQCAFPRSDRWPTVVLLGEPNPVVVTHELGHALSDALGYIPHCAPVSAYAQTNDTEAFAEALVAYIYWTPGEDILREDAATMRLFDEMAQLTTG